MDNIGKKYTNRNKNKKQRKKKQEKHGYTPTTYRRSNMHGSPLLTYDILFNKIND